MSTVLKGALGTSVLAAVRGRMKAPAMSDDDRAESPENLEGGSDETDAEAEDSEPDAAADDTDATGDDTDAEPNDPDAEADDHDPDDVDTAKSARVRRAEQQRIQAILTHPGAQANAGLAAELAFGARHYSKDEAIALMSAGGSGDASECASGGRLAARMAGKSPKIGSSAPAQPGNERMALVDSVRANIQARHRIKS